MYHRNSQDASIQDLARKYALTLEAIALQTRHIVEQMNSSGHTIRSTYMSGSPAQNAFLVSLLDNACCMPIILRHSYSVAAVLGAAMLRCFSSEYASGRKFKDEKEHCDKILANYGGGDAEGEYCQAKASPKDQKVLY